MPVRKGDSFGFSEAEMKRVILAMQKAFRAERKRGSKLIKKVKSTRKRLMTLAQKKALIKAIGKNKSMKPSSRKAAIRKIRAKKTRKS